VDWKGYFDEEPSKAAAPKQDWTGYFDEDEPAQPEGRSVGGFLDNVGTNAYDIGSGIAGGISTFMQDPKGTISNVLSTPPGEALDAVGDMIRHSGGDLGFKFNPDKSVGWDAEKLGKNLYERPIDVGLSASMVTPAVANPLRLTAKAGAKVGAVPAKAAKYVTGEMSGLGPKAIEEAYRTGRVGGVEGKAYRAGARGELDPDTPVDIARGAVGELKADRSAEYLQGKAGWAADTKPLAWEPVEEAFNSTMGIKRHRGKDLKPSVAKARDQVRGVLDEWKADPGSWTAEGFDALKQRLEDIRQGLNPLDQGAARSMVGATIAAVRRQIVKQAPDYAKSMKAYEQASRAIDEVTRTMSLGGKASYDTALRKLQSVLRNNALTNYSARAKLADLLSKKAPELMPMLSGMAANTWTPRGLPGKLLGGLATGGAGYGAAAAMFDPMSLLTLAGTAAASSPRVVGEVAHGLGRARGAVSKVPSQMAAYLLSLGQEQ
jgi:hypothetical protein